MPLRPRQRLMLSVTFVSGLVSLALEVLWTRMMLQGTGSSIYVFVAVVAVFLTGIAGGSLVYERQKRYCPERRRRSVHCWRSRPCSPCADGRQQPERPAAAAAGGRLHPAGDRRSSASRSRSPSGSSSTAPEKPAAGVGLVYAANTAGCVAGTVLAGFVLIPALGTSAAIMTVCLALRP